MRASTFFSLVLLSSLGACAPAEEGAGPGSGSTAALVDFAAPQIVLPGVEQQEPVSVVVRDARGIVIPASAVTWTSDNPAVVEVTGNGSTATLRSRSAGSANVRAVAGTAASEVNVKVLAVRSLDINQPALSMRAFATSAVSATVDAEAGALRNVRWSIDNTAIASISSSGVVNAISVGTTSIRATAVGDPRLTANIELTVTPGPALSMQPGVLTMWLGDANAVLAEPEVGWTLSRDVSWTTDHANIATVNGSGVVTAISVGTTYVRAASVADPRVKGFAEVRILPARGVSISPAASTLNIGGARTLAANVSIEAGLSRAVIWRSSNPGIVSVSQSGVASALGLGTVAITAISVEDTLRRATASVTVLPVVRGVYVTPTSMTVNSGETEFAAAEVDAEGSLSRTVFWRTSNPTIATVTSAGGVVGVAPGQVTITALSTADTTKRAQVAVTVLPAPAISVSPASATLGTGDTRTLVATINVTGGQSNAVLWRTSNGSVASVTQAGVVTGVSVGTATITALSVEDTLRRASSAITIAPIVRSITVTPPAADLYIGQGLQLSAALTADPGVSTNIIWRSSNTSAATVTSSGMITGVSAGQTTITAVSVADTMKRASSTINVSSRPISVAITQQAVSLSAGQSTSLQAVVSGNPGTSQAVTWSTSNASVVTVSANGLVTAVADGSATITATSQADASKAASVIAVVSSRLVSAWTASRLGGTIYEDVLSITSFGANSAFGVNVVGDVYRWDGSAWTVSARGSSFGTQFTSVHGSSASNVIAVGTRGIVARWDGSHWTPIATGMTNTLLDVYVESPTVAYASGNNGTIIRFNGSSWSSMTSGTLQTLHGIWSSGSTAVAVGNGGEVLRLVGNVWQRQNVPTSETLYGVSGLSGSSIIAVGTFGTIIRFNGSAWTSVNTNGSVADFYTVDANPANGTRYYIASDDGLMQLDGNSLLMVNTPYKPRVFSTAVDASGNVWAGGQRGSIFRSTGGGAFTTISIAPDLLDVWSTSTTNAWAVGEFGFIYRWNGSSWTRQATPTTATLNTVWASGPNDAFAAGDDGTMLRWNGSTWTSTSLPGSSSVYALWGSGSTNVYAVTAAGSVLRYDGNGWTTATTSGTSLWAVYGSSANDVYVSGEDGTLLRYNGSSWTSQSPSGSGTLAGLWTSSTSNVLAVGADGSAGIAYRFNGSSWLSQSTGTSRVLTSIWGPRSTDVYATGDQGTLLRFNGAGWQSMTTGTTDLLWSVTGAPAGGGGAFAVGYNGTILTGSGGSGFMTSAMRLFPRTDLEPSAQALRDPRGLGPVPTGAARRNRKGTTEAGAADRSASDTRAGLQLVKFGPRTRGR